MDRRMEDLGKAGRNQRTEACWQQRALEVGTGLRSHTGDRHLGFVPWTVITGHLWAFGKAPGQLGIVDLLGVGGNFFNSMREVKVSVKTRSKGQGTLDTLDTAQDTRQGAEHSGHGAGRHSGHGAGHCGHSAGHSGHGTEHTLLIRSFPAPEFLSDSGP